MDQLVADCELSMSNYITTYDPETGQLIAKMNVSNRQMRLKTHEHYVEGHYELNEYTVVDGQPVKISDEIINNNKKFTAFVEIRNKRNGLLLDSDYTQLDDIPAEKKALWTEYRQKLRDITEDVTDPNTITFPDPPA